MELVTVKELYKNREAYLDNQVTVGGWVRSIRDSKTFWVYRCQLTVHFLRHFRSYTTTVWTILRRFPS